MTPTEQAVEELFAWTGWSACHTFPLRTVQGWRTPTTTRGWPDFVALRGRHVVAVEVKDGSGRLTPEQRVWLDRFADLDAGHAWLIRPGDLQQMARWLHDPDNAPTIHGYEPR